VPQLHADEGCEYADIKILTPVSFIPDGVTVVVHASNWDHNSYYRRMDSLADTLKMDGNCANAVAGWPHDEAFPCIYSEEDYGVAITGVDDPAGRALPVSITVDRWDEPDLPSGEHPAELQVVVTMTGLTAGQPYILYKYAGVKGLPVGNDYAKGATSKYAFTATKSTEVYTDPNKISSAASTYYMCVPAAAVAATATVATPSSASQHMVMEQ